MAKVQISVDDKLLDRIDSYADENFISRSGLISYVLNEYLNAKELTRMMKNMSKTMQKIADQGTLDDDSMRELEEFQSLCRLMADD